MTELASDEALCPECAEVIKAAAKRCKHCGHVISPSEAVPQEPAPTISGSSAFGCVVLIIGALALMTCFTGGDESEVAQAAEDKENGFHCLSQWDGSHPEFVERVKNRLRDPGSFEHIETRVTPNSNGRHRIYMDYRSRNGFGGMNVGSAVGSFDHQTCVPTDPTLSE